MAFAPEAKTLRFDIGEYLLEFVDPTLPADKNTTGDRFIRAGWLKSLRIKKINQPLLVEKSIHSRLPQFGCPFEIYPGPILSTGQKPGKETRMQIGVGIVQEKGEGRFETNPIEWFSWDQQIELHEKEIHLIARQTPDEYNGYRYELKLTVILKKNSNKIIFLFELRNNGKKRIQTELYAHPFFKQTDDGISWFSWKTLGKCRITNAVPSRLVNHDLYHCSTGQFGKNNVKLNFSCFPPANRVEFWHNNNGFFSLEPFWQLSVEPAQSVVRKLELSFSCHEASEFPGNVGEYRL